MAILVLTSHVCACSLPWNYWYMEGGSLQIPTEEASFVLSEEVALLYHIRVRHKDINRHLELTREVTSNSTSHKVQPYSFSAVRHTAIHVSSAWSLAHMR